MGCSDGGDDGFELTVSTSLRLGENGIIPVLTPSGTLVEFEKADLVGKPMSELEGMFIAETLKVTGGNREEAAGMLGIGERTLYRKIKEFGLN